MRSRALLWQILMLSAALAVGCRGADDTTTVPGEAIESLRGRILGEVGNLVVPGRGWTRRLSGRWVYEGRQAELWVRIVEPVTMPTTLRFRLPEAWGLDATWDGRAIDLAGVGGGLRELTLPAADLTPGLHLLRMLPIDATGAHGAQSILWLVDAGTGVAPPAWLDGAAGRQLGEFLEFGLAGPAGGPLHDGLLTVGPLRLSVDLGHARGGTFAAFLASAAGGRVRVALPGRREAAGAAQHGVVLRPGLQQVLRVAVPAGTRRLDLEVTEVGPGGLVSWGGPWLLAGAQRVPTLVLISLDTVRRDALGLYGAAAGVTPRLDRLGAAATVYDRASSTTSWTLPAHASMFTGLYPAEHRAGVTSDRLELGFETLAERLSADYVTAGFVGGALLRYPFGVGQGFGTYRVPDHWSMPGRESVGEVLELLPQIDGLPLFLFVNLFDAHFSYLPPEDSPYRDPLSRAIERIPAGSRWRELLAGDGRAWSDLIQGRIEIEPEGLAALRLAYAAEVHEVDRQVGELLDALERAGRLDDALVVITADHGELLGEGGYFSHAARLDPELVDIPLIVKYPRQREAARVSTPVSLIDLFPTFLRAAGLEVPASSAISLPLAGTSSARAGVLFEENEHWVHPLPASMRLGKTIHGFDGGPGRRVRWPAGEQCQEGTPPDRVAVACSESLRTLHESLRQQLEQTDRGAGPEPPRELEAAERVRLEALGYL